MKPERGLRRFKRAVWKRTSIPTIPGLWIGGVLVIVGIVVSLVRGQGSERPHIKGLPDAPKAVVVAELDAAAFSARLAQLGRKAATTAARCRRTGMVDLGLLRPGTEETAWGQTGWVERIIGGPPVTAFYATGTDTLYVVVRQPEAIKHELIHAYDDQTSSRLREADAATTTDEALALRAAIEGSAVWATEGRPLALPWGADMDRNALVLSYGVGPLVVRTLARRQGPKAAMEWTPRTTASVLTGMPRDPVEVPGGIPPGALCTDRLGGLGVMTSMLNAGAGWLAAKSVYESWLGDRVVVTAGPAGSIATWTVMFDDSLAAVAWRSRVGTGLANAHAGSSIVTLVIPQPQLQSDLGQEPKQHK